MIAVAITGLEVAKPKAATAGAKAVEFEAAGLVAAEPIASGPKAFEVVDKKKEKWSKKKHVVPMFEVTTTSTADAAFVEGGLEGDILALSIVLQPPTNGPVLIAETYMRLLANLVPSSYERGYWHSPLRIVSLRYGF